MFNKIYKKLLLKWTGLSKKRKNFLIVSLSGLLVVIAIPMTVKAGVIDGLASIMGSAISVIINVLAKLITVELNIFSGFAQFNHFLDVTAVKEGWKLVRDLCNMFFIVILLVISFATILRIESYAYKKWLGKLVIAAILINFSKTITGFFIGMSQVVMLTFVSAFKDAVAGNLAQGLHLTEMMKASASGEMDKAFGDQVVDAMAVFGTLALALVLLTVFVIVMLIMIVILVGRIVSLWVLVILSPAAYLLQASPFGAKYSKQWWQEFGKNLISGPVLAFFLWLAFLTIQRSGERGVADMRAQQTNAQGDLSFSAETPQFLSGISKTSYLMDYIVTIALLIAAIGLTQQLGVIGSSFAGKMQQNLGKWGKKVAGGLVSRSTKGTRKGLDRFASTKLMPISQFIPGTTAYGMRKEKIAAKDKIYDDNTREKVGTLASNKMTEKGSSRAQRYMYSTLGQSASASAEEGYGVTKFLKRTGAIQEYDQAMQDSENAPKSIDENDEVEKEFGENVENKDLRLRIDIKTENERLDREIKNNNTTLDVLKQESKEAEKSDGTTSSGRTTEEIQEDIRKIEDENSKKREEKEKNNKILRERKDENVKERRKQLIEGIKEHRKTKTDRLKKQYESGQINFNEYSQEKKRIKSNYRRMIGAIRGGFDRKDPLKNIEKVKEYNQSISDTAFRKVMNNSPYFKLKDPSILLGGPEQYKRSHERYDMLQGKSGDDQAKFLNAAIENKDFPAIDLILKMMAGEGNIDSALESFKDENGKSLTNDFEGLKKFINILQKKTSMSDDQIGQIAAQIDQETIKGQDYQYGRFTARDTDGSVKILSSEKQADAMSAYLNYVKSPRNLAREAKKGLIINNQDEINQVGLNYLLKSGKNLANHVRDMNTDFLITINDNYEKLKQEGVSLKFLDNVRELIQRVSDSPDSSNPNSEGGSDPNSGSTSGGSGVGLVDQFGRPFS